MVLPLFLCFFSGLTGTMRKTIRLHFILIGFCAGLASAHAQTDTIRLREVTIRADRNELFMTGKSMTAQPRRTPQGTTMRDFGVINGTV